jgi:hypothetical protein
MHRLDDQIGRLAKDGVALLRYREMLPADLAGLAHARVEARVGHEGIGRFEPMDVADLREDPEAGYARAAGNRSEAPPLRIESAIDSISFLRDPSFGMLKRYPCLR